MMSQEPAETALIFPFLTVAILGSDEIHSTFLLFASLGSIVALREATVFFCILISFSERSILVTG